MKKSFLFLIAIMVFRSAWAVECSNWEVAPISETIVKHWMVEPGYTTFDERVWERSGDAVAAAILKWVPDSQLDTRIGIRKVLSILELAFDAPYEIETCGNRKARATTLLLDKIGKMKNGQETGNYLPNVRYKVAAAEKTGQALTMIPAGNESDFERTRWIGEILESVHDLTVGMTRKQLLDVFTTEGGISTPQQQTYVHKLCHLVKVDVKFSTGRNPQSFEEMPGDVIVSISKPYLDYGHYD